MEENDVIKEIKRGSYITGIIGAILGGLIGAIPWVLVYIEGNMIVSLLAMIISLGALKGYKIFKGKIAKPMKTIVVIISLLIVIFSNLVIIPSWLAVKNDFTIEYMYENEEIKSAILRDLAVSVLFAILGISLAITNINKTLMENGLLEDQKEIMKKAEELQRMQIDNKLNEKEKQEINVVREVFESLNATNKKCAISKEEIISKMTLENNEKVFKKFNSRGVIVKYKGKYFYDKSKEVFLTKQYLVTYIIIFIIIVSAFSIMSVDNTEPISIDNDLNIPVIENYVFDDGSFSMEISSDWEEEKNNYGTLYMQNTTDGTELIIIHTNKEDIDFSLEDYRDLIGEYVGTIYEIESEGTVEECKINGNRAYSLSFDILYSGRKLTLVAYCVETENYLLEIYTFSARSKVEENKIEFLSILNTLEEVKENI